MMDYLRYRIEHFLDYIADALVDIDLDFYDEPFDEKNNGEVA